MKTPILQFGTSRFLQAHADLFISEAMETGAALGPVTVVQTTGNPSSAARIAAMAAGNGYPVRVRGLRDGQPVDDTVRVRSITRALQANRDWPSIRRIAVEEADVILSNTGESGFAIAASDRTASFDTERPPESFPVKLLALLRERWEKRPDAALTVMPCELLPGNGAVLRGLVSELARERREPDDLLVYLAEHVVWANSLVDRIVSEPLSPVGAVAEPYALWAIERQPRLVLPCRHPAMILTEDLTPFEHRKLHLLNLGHTMLAEHWLRHGAPADRTVLQAMTDPQSRAVLEETWKHEILPVFALLGDGPAADDYVETVRERFLNPFLAHHLSDIAQNHDEKKRRRLRPMRDAAARLAPCMAQPNLCAALESSSHV